MTSKYKLEVSYNDLTNIFSQKHPGADRDGIKRAYAFANEKHGGVRRRSGEPYINHCLRAARLLAEHGFDSICMMAALLHDVVEDCDVTLTQIRELFGREVAKTVDAVTALSDRDYDGRRLTKKQRDILSDAKFLNKVNTRALYVKIADRIDNLSTISCFSEEKRLLKAPSTHARC